MKVIVVRHGQSQDSADGLCQRYDCPLSALGKKQARLVAERLKNEQVDVIYTTPVERAHETARIVAVHHPGTPLIVHNCLEERSMGSLRGTEEESVIATIHESDSPFFEWCPPEGESLLDANARIIPCFEQLFAEHPDGTIMLVMHAAVFALLLVHLKGLSLEETTFSDFLTSNTAITIFTWDGQHVTIKRFNDVSHLGDRKEPKFRNWLEPVDKT